MSLWNIRVLETFYDTRITDRRSSFICNTKKLIHDNLTTNLENRRMTIQQDKKCKHNSTFGKGTYKPAKRRKGQSLLKVQSAARIGKHNSSYIILNNKKP